MMDTLRNAHGRPFTPDELSYITGTVAQAAKNLLGDKLAEVILYGSYARGDYHAWSDVDVMVLADVDETHAKIVDDKLFEALGDLDFELDLRLSPTTISREQFEHWLGALPFYQNVKREGVRIYHA